MYDQYHVLIQSALVPTAFVPLVLLAGGRSSKRSAALAIIPLIYSTALLVYANITAFGGKLIARYSWAPPFTDLVLLLDGISGPVALAIALLSTFVCAYSAWYMEGRPGVRYYFALLLMYASGMIGTVLSAHLIAFFLFFEYMLLPSWALIGVWGTGRKELIALKYFLFTEAGALLFLAGMAATYSMTGTLNLLEISSRVKGVSVSALVPVAAAMLVGLFVKMAIVPLHTWLPDAHAEAPTPISALLSPAMIGIGGYASIRVLYQMFPQLALTRNFTTALMALAVVTMAYGGLMALAQTDIKRLLAYSSISQMGYMLLGIASATTTGLVGADVIYVSHALAKAPLFMLAGVLAHAVGTRDIRKMRGLAKRMPLTATCALASFLCLSGVPPLIGFWGELLVFLGSIYSSLMYSVDLVRLALACVAIVLSVLTAAYGLWTIKRIFYGELTKELAEVREEPRWVLALIFALIVLQVLLGIYPTPLIAAITSGARLLGA